MKQNISKPIMIAFDVGINLSYIHPTIRIVNVKIQYIKAIQFFISYPFFLYILFI
nr:MAG TPA: hypothetical protein [Caudoviricetes sp.]